MSLSKRCTRRDEGKPNSVLKEKGSTFAIQDNWTKIHIKFRPI